MHSFIFEDNQLPYVELENRKQTTNARNFLKNAIFMYYY